MSRIGKAKGRQFKRLRYRLRKAAQAIRIKIRNRRPTHKLKAIARFFRVKCI